MRRALLIALLLLLLPGAVSARPSSDYQYWFESYLKRFQDCSFSMSAKDKEELNYLLKIKPTINAGQSYNLWFVKAFCWWIEECGPILDNNEIEKFNFLMSAMPSLEGSGQSYSLYFEYVLKQIDDFMPILDNVEKTYMGYFRKARPHALESDYQPWLKEYNRLRQEYGPNYSSDENLVLQLVNEIRPSSGGGENAVLQVKRDRLLRIRTLILTNQPEVAVGEIDQILAGH